MKKISLLLIGIITFGAVSAQNNLELTFKKLKNNDNVISLSFDEKVMDYVENKDKDWKTLIDKVEIIMFDSSSDLADNDKAKMDKALSLDQYDLLIDAKSKEGKVKLYSLSKEHHIASIYATMKADKYQIYFLVKGNIVLEELSEMGLNFKGAEAFDMLKRERDK